MRSNARQRSPHWFMGPGPSILPRLLAAWAGLFLAGETTLMAGGPPPEPPGPSTRRTGLVISEIMYHPAPRTDGRNLEFIEIYNSEAIPTDIGGFRLSGDVDYRFPTNASIAARGFLVVAAVPADVENVYGLTNVWGGFGNGTNSLPNDSGLIRLRNRTDAVLLEVRYSDQTPWPAAADGAGHSLSLARPSLGERDPRAWSASARIGGSPGTSEPGGGDPRDAVVINEFLAHTDDPELDYIELYNHSSAAVDLSACIVTDDPATNRFVIPVGTILPARGFVSYDQAQLHFSLSAAGETIYLLDSNGTKVIDAIRFGGQENGVASGRFPDGSDQIYRLLSKTPGAPNTGIRISDVAINELMYHSISGEDRDQYLELYNQGTARVNLSGWELSDGIQFVFPTNSFLDPGGYLVVARDVDRLLTNHPGLEPARVLGDFTGRLSSQGERIVLTMPDQVVSTNEFNQVETNTIHIALDEVTYNSGGRWGRWADGGGSSLELIDPRADHRLASNWADSDETRKSPWTRLETTGLADNGNTGYAINNLQVLLQDDGECLLDDVEVIGPGGANRIANGNFETGTQNWFFQGTHERSGPELSGFGGSAGSLHLRASGKGDTGANRVRTALTSILGSGQTVTIRAQARWLRGRPDLLLRLHGNSVELAGRMEVPTDLGTPGAPNSQAVPNTGPALFDVTHSPALPAANQSVIVTARAADPDGLASLQLLYRSDPDTNYTVISMSDDGSNGDLVAGDGVYSGAIPPQTNGTLIAFHLEARDAATPGLASWFPADAPARECLVRYGESVPGGSFGSYRFWVTKATLNRWTSRPKLSNDPLDATFVYGNSRVVYNVGVMFSGSPFHQPAAPTSGASDYTLLFPRDDLFLGATDVHLSFPGNGGDDPTGQREQAAYWVAGQLGLPFNHRRFVHLFINGIRRSFIMEDTQRANSDVIDQWFPDAAGGDLHKIAGWFEYDDAASGFNVVWATLQNFTTPDQAIGPRVKDVGRYRWNWQKRAEQNTPNDYTSLFELVDAANTTGAAYLPEMARVVDVEQWLRTFAAEHLVGNWDSYGNRNGQNMYAYKPPDGRWRLLIWDLDIALGGIGDGPTSSLFQVTDSVIGRLYSNPDFRRLYYRILQEALDSSLNTNRAYAPLDAKFAAFQASGIPASAPSGIKSYLTGRRNHVISQLRGVASGFAVTSNGGADFSTATNQITLTGTAPIDVVSISVNGVDYRPNWTSVTSWSLVLPLADGVNSLAIAARDSHGNLLLQTGASLRVTVVSPNDSPLDHLVINEIMYHPAVPGAAFIEIHNMSTQTTFDLSGYRLDGADFTFPGGTSIAPGGFAVVVNDLDVFARTYGRLIPVAGVFTGQLDNRGETIRLLKPGTTPAEDLVIDQVAYSARAPWPTLADGGGPSLQLIDASRDNERVANWSAVDSGAPGLAPFTPGATNSVAATLPPFPDVRLNEIQARNLNGPTNLLGQHAPWVELYNPATNEFDLGGYFLTDNYTNLARWSFPAGASIQPGQFLMVWLDGATNASNPGELHASFRLETNASSLALAGLINDQPTVLDQLDWDSVIDDQSFGLIPDGNPADHRRLYYPTPGAANDPSPGPATVFINEWLASNVADLADSIDQQFEDWIELYNPNSAAVDLTGFTMTDDPTNAVRWAIPPGTVIDPHGHLLVWADKEPAQNSPTNTDLHANFKLDKDGDQIALFGPAGQLIDAVQFGEQTDDVSAGRYPDGGVDFRFMSVPTPRSPNVIPTNPLPELRIRGIGVSPGNYVALLWDAIPGHSYRVEVQTELAGTSWSPLPGDVFAYHSTASKADPDTSLAGPRFYRVVLIK